MPEANDLDVLDVLADIADQAVALARRDEQVEVYAVDRTTTTVQVGALDVVRQVGRSQSRGAGISVLVGSRLGFASTSDFSAAGIASALQHARANGAIADPDDAVTLAEPNPTDVDSSGYWQPTIEQMPLEHKVDLARAVARESDSVDASVRVDTAEYYDEQACVAIASTRGMRAKHRRTHAHAYVDVVAKHGSDIAADWAWWTGRDPRSLDPEALASEAARRTLRLLSAPAAAPMDIPVILDQSVVADLLAVVGKGCSGGPISSGRTPFAGLQQSLVGSDAVTLVDDAASTDAPGGAVLDDEGVRTQRTRLISRGVLVGTLHTTTTAAAVGGDARSTGNARRATHKSPARAAPRALTLEPTASWGELIARVPEAVYVQQLSGAGSGINPVTGRVVVGGVAFLLRDGEPVGTLPTFAITTSLTAFLSSIDAVVDDARPTLSQPVSAPTVLCSPGWLGR